VDEGEVLGRGADERGQRVARLVEQRLQLVDQEADRLPLEPPPQPLLRVLHHDRTGAERAVVEVGGLGVEAEVMLHGRSPVRSGSALRLARLRLRRSRVARLLAWPPLTG